MEEITLTTLYQMILDLQSQMAQSQSQIIQILRAEIKVTAEETKKELRAEMKQMGEELRAEMKQMGEELRAEIKATAEETKSELRAEMKQMKTDILSEVGDVIVDTMSVIGKNQAQAFQNHEKRIVRLEDLNGIPHETLKVCEEKPPEYNA